MADIATARIYLAEEALALGLVDQVGYFEDALDVVRRLAALPDDIRLIAYRRETLPDDNVYQANASVEKLEAGILDPFPDLKAGFYYLWLPGSAL